MQTAIKHETVDMRTHCIVNADDLAMLPQCGIVASLSIRLSRNDKLIYNNQEVDFVSKCKYLGVMFQTKGGNSEHLEMLKRKGISACARIPN